VDYKNICEKEVVDMHRFFTEWYTGVLPENDENFVRFYGSHEKGAFDIEIKNFKYLAGHEGLHVLGYEEWQRVAGNQIILETTTVLKGIENRYNQMEWLRIHVTEKK